MRNNKQTEDGKILKRRNGEGKIRDVSRKLEEKESIQ